MGISAVVLTKTEEEKFGERVRIKTESYRLWLNQGAVFCLDNETLIYSRRLS